MQKKIELKILDSRWGDALPLPGYITRGAAGMDLRAMLNTPLEIGSCARCGTAFPEAGAPMNPSQTVLLLQFGKVATNRDRIDAHGFSQFADPDCPSLLELPHDHQVALAFKHSGPASSVTIARADWHVNAYERNRA